MSGTVHGGLPEGGGMRIGIVTTDVAFSFDVTDRFDAVRQGISWVVVRPEAPLPRAALLLFDSAASPNADRIHRSVGCPRWLLWRGSGAPDAKEGGWDEVVRWPAEPGPLAALLEGARVQIRARPGVASPELLAAGMRRVAELASESIEITDLSVRLLYVNPAFEQLTGWSLEDVVGHSTGELFRAGAHDPSYYAAILATLRRGEVWRGPLIARRRTGDLSFQEATLAPLLGADGEPAAFVAIKRDLARDTLAERAMENRELRLQTMLEGAGDGVFVHDNGGVLADANPSACAMLGVERGALICGRRIGEFLDGVSEEALVSSLAALTVGEPITIEGSFRRADGRTLAVSLRLAAFVFAGERFVLTLARDVSERVDLERRLRLRTEELAASLEDLRAAQHALVQHEKLSALGELVAGVAHEVNTPLGTALTALSHGADAIPALRAAITSPGPSRRAMLASLDELAEAFRLAYENGRRAATLISNFKKVAVDQASEAERDIELADYLAAILSSLSPLLRAQQVNASFAGEPVSLLTRPGAIAQIITNVIQNAVVHAFVGVEEEKKLWVRCRPEGSTALIEVEDHGVGIPPHVLSRVFDPFVTTRMGQGGSGLGMYVVHNLVVEVLGGTVEVRSSPGSGTCVRIALPLARPATADAVRPPGPGEEPAGRSG